MAGRGIGPGAFVVWHLTHLLLTVTCLVAVLVARAPLVPTLAVAVVFVISLAITLASAKSRLAE